MKVQYRRLFVLFAPIFLFLIVSTLPSKAQQPDPQPAAQPAPDAPVPKPAQDSNTQDASKRNDQTGKSKLEKETGTVNDRIFEVLPNYGTVENRNALPPLTFKQKFRLATAGVFDWGAYPFNAALAGIAQAENNPKE